MALTDEQMDQLYSLLEQWLDDNDASATGTTVADVLDDIAED